MLLGSICRYGKTLRSTLIVPTAKLNTKSFEWWINCATNKYEPERCKEVGADRAAAEWCIRNMAKFRWKGFVKWEDGFLDDVDYHQYIEAIDATNSTINADGFEYLNGLEYVEQLLLRRCSLVDDPAIKKLEYIEKSLRYVELVSCPAVTDDGLISLSRLKNLEVLKLFDLMSVKEIDSCREFLEAQLPNCHISLFKI